MMSCSSQLPAKTDISERQKLLDHANQSTLADDGFQRTSNRDLPVSNILQSDSARQQQV